MPLTYFKCVDTLLAYCNKSIPANQKNRPFGLCKSSTRDIVEFYNLRGGKERIFDDMNNGFGWSRLPKSFMAENTVFLLLTALIHNFYKTIMSRLDTKAFGLKKTSRIKAFVFRFISVPAKWIMTARQYVLNIYTENRAYAKPFKTEFG